MSIVQFAYLIIPGLVIGHVIGAWALTQQDQSLGRVGTSCFRLCMVAAGALIGFIAAGFPPWPGMAVAGLGWALLAVSALDLRAMVISDGMALPVAAAGLVMAALDGMAVLALHAAAALAGFLAIWLVSRGIRMARGVEAIGSGDAVLLAAAGAWVGPDLLPVVMVTSGLVGMCALGVMAAASGASLQTRIPFGPAIALAAWLAYVLKLSGGI